MKFCEKCGSYMEKTHEGFSCPQCGRVIHLKISDFITFQSSNLDSVYVVDSLKIDYKKINQICPQCGNFEAFRQLSSTSGDHAGVKQERTLEHLKCTKCHYSWSRS